MFVIAIDIYFIMLVLCLMLLMTYYAQNYTGIIDGSLVISVQQLSKFWKNIAH